MALYNSTDNEIDRVSLDGTNTSCPICGSSQYTTFFENRDVPVQDGVLWQTLEEALNSPTGDIILAFCKECGYIGNRSFDPQKIRYDSEYNFSLHFSPLYQDFINKLVKTLVDKYSLVNKTVLEIGCGQGDFLRLLCNLGIKQGIGIDPTLKPEVIDRNCSGQIEFIKDFYSEKYQDIQNDIVCCRHVLNSLLKPRDFIEMLYHNLIDKPNTTVYFETPNGNYTLEQLRIWNIVYEHCSWFTPYSISKLFEISGFKVTSSGPCFGGQYLGIEAVPGSEKENNSQLNTEGLEETTRFIGIFQSKYQRIVNFWREQLELMKNQNLRIASWGAGASAIGFLSMFQVRDTIPYVVDINPLRQGQYLPRTGQLVVPPDFILQYKPDVVIITNPIYEKEIKQQVSDQGVVCEILTL